MGRDQDEHFFIGYDVEDEDGEIYTEEIVSTTDIVVSKDYMIDPNIESVRLTTNTWNELFDQIKNRDDVYFGLSTEFGTIKLKKDVVTKQDIYFIPED